MSDSHQLAATYAKIAENHYLLLTIYGINGRGRYGEHTLFDFAFTLHIRTGTPLGKVCG